MLRHAIPLVITGLCLAQNPGDLFEKAPPDVEEALRARVTKFYEAYQSGRFRLGDVVVHEDSKDEFFNSEKTKIKAFEIGKIKYSDNFTKASVTTLLDQDYNTQFGRIPIKLPMTTQWKLDNGEWWWFTIKASERDCYPTLFGCIKAPKDGVAGGEVRPPQASAGTLPPMPDPVKLLGGVRADKSEVQLTGSPASAAVIIQNQMPGDVILRVQLENPWPGLTATLDKTQLKSEEKANLTVRDTSTGGQTRPSAVAKVIIAPTQRVIPIRILPATTP